MFLTEGKLQEKAQQTRNASEGTMMDMTCLLLKDKDSNLFLNLRQVN